jgi:Tol biopolymer transport system component
VCGEIKPGGSYSLPAILPVPEEHKGSRIADFSTQMPQGPNKPIIPPIKRMGGGLLLLVVAVPVGLLLYSFSEPGGLQEEPLGETSNGKIAFVSDRDGYYDIFVINADGTGKRNLTDTTTAYENVPVWSPDGEMLAFTRQDVEDGKAGIFVMNSDGSGQTRLTDDAMTFSQLAWSPDGKKIAFSRVDGAGASDIFVMNSDGSSQINLTTTGDFEVHLGTPVWSPDGKKLAFRRNTTEVTSGATANASALVYEMSGIYVVNADGTGQNSLTTSPLSDAPTWSPNGEKLAFVEAVGDEDIYTINSDGSDRTSLTNSPANEYDPAWSPDGKKISFLVEDRTSTNIYVMNADGTGRIRLTDTIASEAGAAWSPDAEKIAFWASGSPINAAGRAICVIDVDGTGRTCLAEDVIFDGSGVAWGRR